MKVYVLRWKIRGLMCYCWFDSRLVVNCLSLNYHSADLQNQHIPMPVVIVTSSYTIWNPWMYEFLMLTFSHLLPFYFSYFIIYNWGKFCLKKNFPQLIHFYGNFTLPNLIETNILMFYFWCFKNAFLLQLLFSK